VSAETQTPFEQTLLDDLLRYQQDLPATHASTEERRIVPTRHLVLIGVVLAAIALAAGAAVVLSRSHHAAAPPKTGKQVAQRMLQALTTSDDQIMVETSQNTSIQNPAGPNPTPMPSGHSVQYLDLATGRFRAVEYGPDGSIAFETVSGAAGGAFQMDMVIYPGHAWMTTTFPNHGEAHRHDLADSLRQMVADGVFTLVGRGTIDGENVLHLQREVTLPAGNGPVPAPESLRKLITDLWVDASTFLPVRQTTENGTGIVTQTSTYTFLPRTAANLANLKLVVPPGFTHQTGSSGSSGSFSFSSGSVTLTHP
jgi:hypothetical protein